MTEQMRCPEWETCKESCITKNAHVKGKLCSSYRNCPACVPVEKCGDCGGSGKLPMHANKASKEFDCPTCKGSGWVDSKPEQLSQPTSADKAIVKGFDKNGYPIVERLLS
jgi:hypothetical protein